jgi:hypothetical protein
MDAARVQEADTAPDARVALARAARQSPQHGA